MITHSSYRLPSLVPIIVLGNAYCFLRRYGLALIAAVVVLSVSFMAVAGSNIKQKDTGATVWEDQDGKQVPVGTPGLTILLENVSSASTAYVVTHKAGKIVKVYSVLFGQITAADAAVDIFIANAASPTFFDLVTPSATLTLSWVGSAAGDIDTISPTAANAVSQGQTLAVHTDGASTTDIDAIITIIIE